MNRKSFLKAAGTVGLTSLLPMNRVRAAAGAVTKADILGGAAGTCVLIPQETRGPYPLDLSSNQAMFRPAINESKTGIPLTVTYTLVNLTNNCAPIPNVRVDVWHCDKDGFYSGYNQPGGNTIGQTFCRGIQMTDANGQVTFMTIYPGWYNGRITHIHFEMYISSVLKATSQMAFPDALNRSVYATPLYAGHGQNTSVANNMADMVFGNSATDLSYQLAAISGDATTGYTASLAVGINATVLGLVNAEPETGGQFKLNQNYPNPFQNSTVIPFTLTQGARVTLELFDMMGRKVAKLLDEQPLASGDHSYTLGRQGQGYGALAQGNYVYQFTTTNNLGTFRQCKVLTAF